MTNPNPAASAMPPCPSCGSREHVIRMATSLTPFARPDSALEEGHFYCQSCSHDFEPVTEIEEDET